MSSSLSRRTLLGAGLLAGVAPGGRSLARPHPVSLRGSAWPDQVPLGPARRFDFERLKRMARDLAARPYAPPPAPDAERTAHFSYDAFGAVSYRPEATLWPSPGLARAVRFYPLGAPAPRPVAMHIVQGDQAREILYTPSLFREPADKPLEALGAHAGFGGFRVLNAKDETDWLSFLGASYFRCADPFNQYGLSARGLAINTARTGHEEFPAFRAFWIEGDPTGPLTVYALLDGPSVVGAYRLAHARGPQGLVQTITVALRFRAAVDQLGLAPLTSMYWYNANDRTPRDDWRPQIHDSDGLSIWTGAGERLWRPLRDPPRDQVQLSLFPDRGPRGFGLMQRERHATAYQDDLDRYELRPSAWVEPIGDWGPGAVSLVELPSDTEAEDNIDVFWTPAAPVRAGQDLAYAYRLHWTDEEPGPVNVARTLATRTGPADTITAIAPPGGRRFVIDFQGAPLDALTSADGVTPQVRTSRGRLLGVTVTRGEGLWRLRFDLEAPLGAPIDLRASLTRDGAPLTETWAARTFS